MIFGAVLVAGIVEDVCAKCSETLLSEFGVRIAESLLDLLLAEEGSVCEADAPSRMIGDFLSEKFAYW